MDETQANIDARFLPGCEGDGHPALEVAGVMVSAGISDGAVLVEIDVEGADKELQHGTELPVPVQVNVSGRRVHLRGPDVPTYEPWVNGRLAGFKMTFPNGNVRYVYLSAPVDEDPDEVGLHEGPDGDPMNDQLHACLSVGPDYAETLGL